MAKSFEQIVGFENLDPLVVWNELGHAAHWWGDHKILQFYICFTPCFSRVSKRNREDATPAHPKVTWRDNQNLSEESDVCHSCTTSFFVMCPVFQEMRQRGTNNVELKEIFQQHA